MLYTLSSPPTPEGHSENLIHLFVRDANGSPLPNTRIKVWAGLPPSGSPPYWVDESPYRLINASGMLEFIVMSGAMPESRDYWMQVIDANNQSQCDPVQFHFPSGGMVWITATLTKEGTSSGGGGGTEPATPINVDLDPRLAPMNVTVKSISVNPGQAYWKIVSAKYQNENESGGNHNIFYTVLDQTGAAAPGVPIFMDWVGRDSSDIPSSRYSDGNGTGDQAMYGGPIGWRPELGPGPYFAWVGDPDYRGNHPTGIPSEKLDGCGLPLNRHVNFIVTWRKVIVPPQPQPKPQPEPQPEPQPLPLPEPQPQPLPQPEPQPQPLPQPEPQPQPIPALTLEQLLFAASNAFTWMPINTDAALYRFAQMQNLGYPQTDEFEFTYDSALHVGQVFNLGIVYVKKGDWGAVKWVKKP